MVSPEFIREAVGFAGSQSIVISIDVKKELFRKRTCYINDGAIKVRGNTVEQVKRPEELDAGEILLNSITHDGTMQGYDI